MKKTRERGGICSECGKKRCLGQRYPPRIGEPICSTCYARATKKLDLCPACGIGPKRLAYLRPQTEEAAIKKGHVRKKERICKTCHLLAKKTGTCPRCGQEGKLLAWRDKENQEVCRSCYRKQPERQQKARQQKRRWKEERKRRREYFLSLSFEEAAKLVVDVAAAVACKRPAWNNSCQELFLLIKASPEKYLEVRRGIYQSPYLAAIGIMKKFDMEEGKELLQMAESTIETK